MSTRVSGAFHAVYMPIVGRTEALRLQWNCVSFRDAGEKVKEKKICVCFYKGHCCKNAQGEKRQRVKMSKSIFSRIADKGGGRQGEIAANQEDDARTGDAWYCWWPQGVNGFGDNW